ncbi:DNA repair protein RecN [Schaalia vaccimaxillae]|uniref:DNA repair protein RecN n=1 Tax=Schaalia vaccimaxillae TaxID=183916 RepID=UPI0003B56BE7|nr:DNA repair protein RecN [Schaalia vaccimaxillae]
MISRIDISSLGVIDEAHLDLAQGLTVLTGETGAGKTMVLTSLQLLLGERADAVLVRTGATQALVDGIFIVPPDIGAIAAQAGGVIEDDELIVSRTIPTQGRSRAHLGGRPVPASLLQEIVGSIVTIHGQTDQLRLKNRSTQRQALDSFGGAKHRKIVEEYRNAWEHAVHVKRMLDEAVSQSATRSDEIEVLRSAIDFIADLDPQPGEDENLAHEARRLTNIQDLRMHVGRAHALLTGSSNTDSLGIVDSTRMVLDDLLTAQRFDSGLDVLSSRLSSLFLELDALTDDIRHYDERLGADPSRLADIQQRRALLKQAMEGRASDVEGLLQWRDQAERRLDELTQPGSDPQTLREKLTSAQDEVLRIGALLSSSRQDLARKLSQAVDAELRDLSMPDAHLEIQLTQSKPASHGLEDIVFALCPHPSAPARPLGQGASGGELSRVMLALEVVLGADSQVQTLIFDEIDAGIGGRTATEVGSRLARLARDRQVIVVTHLAQVAVFAQHHMVISKADGVTTVERVEGELREAELTRMMGGDPDSPAARRNAMQVLGSAVPQSN